MSKTKIILLAELGHNRHATDIDSLIDRLTALRAEALERGLVDCRVDVDWHTDGKRRIWTTKVIADKVTS